MKETGIIMSGNHPNLISDLLKTQTRRTYGLEKINQEPDRWINATPIPKDRLLYANYKSLWQFTDINGAFQIVKCPYGGINDLLWVKETHYIEDHLYLPTKIHYKASEPHYAKYNDVKWQPSIFMFRKDSRIDLKNTDIRPERLQNITEEDAKAEGANPFLLDKLKGGTKYKMLKTYHHEFYPLVDHADEGEIVIFECPNMGYARLHYTQRQEKQDPVFRIPAQEVFEYVGALEPDYRNGFRILWDSLNAKRGYSYEFNPWVFPISFKVVEL